MDDNMANKYEHEIPEGYEARIEGNKVIIEKKESEDDKNWNAIMEYIKDDALRAWLEKKIEYKKLDDVDFTITLENCLKCDSELTSEQAHTFAKVYGSHLYYVANGMIDSGLDKDDIEDYKKEQNLAEWSYPYGKDETVDKLIAIAECLEFDGDCRFNGYSGTECGKFLRELARKQIECKPAEWSEEDEEKINSIIKIICTERECSRIANIGESKYADEYKDNSGFYNELVLFVKSLRPQPKQELSDEDEEIISSIVDDLERLKKKFSGLAGEHAYEVKINWLKSLPLRLSDEEIKKIRSEEYTKGFNDAAFGGKLKEWSEEDEDYMKDLMDYFGHNLPLEHTPHAVRDWLKSLLLNLKKKNEYVVKLRSNEWSDEDEKRIKQLIYDTEAIKAGYEKRKEQLGERFFNEKLIKDCDEQIQWLTDLPYRIFSKQIVNKIDDYINKHTYNAHEMHSEGLEKLNYCKGVDDTLSDICDIINNC